MNKRQARILALAKVVANTNAGLAACITYSNGDEELSETDRCMLEDAVREVNSGLERRLRRLAARDGDECDVFNGAVTFAERQP